MTIQLNDRVRITRPDNLNWELQVKRSKASGNVARALEVRGVPANDQEKPETWRTVGYYSTVPQALHAVCSRYPDLVVDCEGPVMDVLHRIAKYEAEILQLHARDLQERPTTRMVSLQEVA